MTGVAREPAPDPADPLDLDGRTFDMASSTASRVDPDHPTRFRYREAEGVVSGEYEGDTVAVGRFVGTRVGERLEVRFVHVRAADRTTVAGGAVSRIEATAAGLRLVEEFDVDGEPQTSVCVEVRRGT